MKYNLKINDKMRNLSKNLIQFDFNDLTAKLKNLINDGLTIELGDCIVLKNNLKMRKVKISDFIDKTGYECFINKINLEDYVENNDQTPVFFIIQCYLIIMKITQLILGLQKSNLSKYNFIFSINQNDPNINLHSYVLRFHKIREGEVWLEDDINSYNEALLIFSFQKNSIFDQININDFKKDFLSEIQKQI